MGYTGAIGTAAGGLATAYAEHQAGKFNKAIDDYNASVADLQARDAVVRGKLAVQKHQVQVRGLLGAQRVAYAGQGVAVGQDVAAAVASDTEVQARRDETQMRNNALLEAWGFKVQAVSDRSQGQLAEYEGNNRAAGTVLSSTGRAAEMWPQTSSMRVPTKVGQATSSTPAANTYVPERATGMQKQ